MLTVVTGPPCAGKTTYVREHATPGDIIIDYDLLAVALGSPDSHDHPPAIAAVAANARMAAIDAAKQTRVDTWIIHAHPTPQSLAIYRKQGTRVIEIDPGEQVVRQRINDERTAKGTAHQYADRWYAR